MMLERVGKVLGRMYPGGKNTTGWSFVVKLMEHQIETGLATPEHWNEHLLSSNLMTSYLRYQKWTEEHPGEEATGEINAVLTNKEYLKGRAVREARAKPKKRGPLTGKAKGKPANEQEFDRWYRRHGEDL